MAVHNPPCHSDDEHIAVSALRNELGHSAADFYATFERDRTAEEGYLKASHDPYLVRPIETPMSESEMRWLHGDR
jgi:hypothetical protein